MVKENGIKTGQTKRGVIRRGNSRSSTGSNAQESKVKLEQVLGVSATSNNSLSYDPNTENILYTAGCVCVLYNIKKSKQTHIRNDAKKPLTCAAFSSDGAYVVTGESGHQPCVRVWDAASLLQLKELRGHRFGISSVNFSPNSKVVVSVGFTHDSNVCVWNWKTGKQVAGNKVSSRVFGMSFNEKGSYFVTVGIRFVKFWYFNSNDDKALNQLSPCENRAAILDNHRNTTFKSVICGKGKFSHLTFCLSNEGSLYSFGESRRVERWLDLKVNDAFALYVTQEHLLCGCSDGVVRVFEPSSLSHIVNLPKPHPLGVDLASCTSPSCMVSVIPSSEFPDCIGVVADSSTSKVIVLYRDKSLYIWDIANIHRVGKYRSYLFHSACVCAIEVYPQQESKDVKMCLPRGTFITGSSDNTIKIWNLNTLDPGEQIKRNIYSKELLNQIYTERDFSWLRARRGNAVSDNASGITAIAVSPRGDVVASGDKSGNLRVHDLVNLSCTDLAKIEAHDAEILSLSFTRPDSCWHYLVSASRDRLIHVFDVRNDYELVQTICDHSAIVTSVKFVERPNDSQLTLLSCSADKSVRFRTGFKTGTHQLQFQTYQHVQEKSTFTDMEIPPSRDRVVTGCQDRQIRTYELSTGKLLNSFKSGSSEDSGMIVNVALDPSSTYLAAAGSDKCIFLHDAQSGDRLASLYGHSEMITGLKFTNDCKRLISISGDGCIFVWRLSNDVVKNIRSKMKGQGFEPELSADTPNPNRKGDPPLSPHAEYVLPLMDMLSGNKQSESEGPDKQRADTSLTEQSTPENKRKRWSKPTNLTFLDNLTPQATTPCTPLEELTPTPATRTAPDGGEHNDPIAINKVKLEEDRNKAVVVVPPHATTHTGATVNHTGATVNHTGATVNHTGAEVNHTGADVNQEPGEFDEEEEENSAEEDTPNIIYPDPPKVFSPSIKRLSSVFDVNVTPHKMRTTSENTDADVEDDENDITFQEDDAGEEEQVKSDSFLQHKFSEIEEEFDDINPEHSTASLSPHSQHRQSMSRKFYKSSTPENVNSNGVTETPRSKGSSPISSIGSPNQDRVRQAIEKKIEAKKKEKLKSRGVPWDHLTKSRSSLPDLPTTHEEPPRTATSSSDLILSCGSEDFVIHRRQSANSVKSLKLDLGQVSSSSYEPGGTTRSDTDSTSSKYMSVLSKTTSESAACTSDRADNKTNNKSEKDAQKKKVDKLKTKNKLKLAFGGKSKEEKKETKPEKTSKKSKAPLLSKKEVPPGPEHLHTTFRDSLLRYDTILTEKPSASRDQELTKLTAVYRDMLEGIQSRLNTGNMASAGVNGRGQATTPEDQAVKCAELCADKILELIQQKLQNHASCV